MKLKLAVICLFFFFLSAFSACEERKTTVRLLKPIPHRKENQCVGLQTADGNILYIQVDFNVIFNPKPAQKIKLTSNCQR